MFHLGRDRLNGVGIEDGVDVGYGARQETPTMARFTASEGSVVVMLATAVTIVRLSLHVLAATIWVGGQFTLAGLVSTLRPGGPHVATAAARRFAQMAWPSYLVLLGTGVWNVVAVDSAKQSTAWRAVLTVKIAVVVLSGLSAWMHQRSKTTPALALWGAVSGLTAPAALVMGVALAG